MPEAISSELAGAQTNVGRKEVNRTFALEQSYAGHPASSIAWSSGSPRMEGPLRAAYQIVT